MSESEDAETEESLDEDTLGRELRAPGCRQNRGLVIARVTRRRAAHSAPAASFLSPPKYPLYRSSSRPFLRTMSEKLKEFVDIPQQFIRDGNQVCWTS